MAEPNLTAISGETARLRCRRPRSRFPTARRLSCDTTKSRRRSVRRRSTSRRGFGVSLVFTPVVMSEGRISLKVMTEVSDLSSRKRPDPVGAGLDPGFDNSFDLSTRRAETTVEIPSGGSRTGRIGRHQRADQAADQRHAGPDAVADPGRAVQEPRLHINHQSELVERSSSRPLCGARSGAETINRGPMTASADRATLDGTAIGRLNHITAAHLTGPETRRQAGKAGATTASTDCDVTSN